MGADEDKQRASSARDQRRLRASLGEEPSSSYAYHDEARVEHIRAPVSARPANDTVSTRGSNPSLMGGHHAPQKLAHLVSPMIRTASTPRRPKLSEPPEIGSWPPLPNVPDGLEEPLNNAVTPPAKARSSGGLDDAHTSPPGRTSSAAGPSGAIWSATPSVVSLTPKDDAAHEQITAAHEYENDAHEPREQYEENDEDLETTSPGRYAHDLTPVVAHVLDTDVTRLDQLVARGAWEELTKLGGDANRSALLRLMHVIALRETSPSDAKGAAKLTQEAIVALSELLGLPSTSPTALMLTKRLLRRNPVWTHSQPATGVSASIVIIGLLVGCGIGWWLTRFVM